VTGVLPEALTRRLSDWCPAAARYYGVETIQIDCYLKPGHAGLHWDKNLCVWWAAWDESLMVPVQFEEPEPEVRP
jgi:hypothetical protein